MFIVRNSTLEGEVVDTVRDHLDYYSHRWIQLKLKGLSPIQYQKQSFKSQSNFLESNQFLPHFRFL
ncbi:IS3 family transposase [Haemophilus haemolyticus]|uniref:IS3 family transposase n=1 Tax=Haemophilus haemolyticus TaxID=726 RepID=UPI003B97DEDD